MKRKNFLVLLVILSLLLELPSSAQAAVQSGVKLGWFLHLSGSGGQAASTTSQVSFTIGQSAIGSFSSPGTRIGLGFWQGETILYRAWLPAVRK